MTLKSLENENSMQMLSASDPTTGILASLPAILAVMAFVIYQIILSHRTADEITKNIVDKLRAQSPQADRLEGLPAAKVVELLKGDQELKAKLDKGDSRILLKIAEQEHKKSLFVYRLIGFLFVVVVFTNCKKDSISTNPSQLSPESIPQSVGGNTVASASILSQTKTANRFNWNGNPYLNVNL